MQQRYRVPGSVSTELEGAAGYARMHYTPTAQDPLRLPQEHALCACCMFCLPCSPAPPLQTPINLCFLTDRRPPSWKRQRPGGHAQPAAPALHCACAARELLPARPEVPASESCCRGTRGANFASKMTLSFSGPELLSSPCAASESPPKSGTQAPCTRRSRGRARTLVRTSRTLGARSALYRCSVSAVRPPSLRCQPSTAPAQ